MAAEYVNHTSHIIYIYIHAIKMHLQYTIDTIINLCHRGAQILHDAINIHCVSEKNAVSNFLR